MLCFPCVSFSDVNRLTGRYPHLPPQCPPLHFPVSTSPTSSTIPTRKPDLRFSQDHLLHLPCFPGSPRRVLRSLHQHPSQVQHRTVWRLVPRRRQVRNSPTPGRGCHCRGSGRSSSRTARQAANGFAVKVSLHVRSEAVKNQVGDIRRGRESIR